MTQDEKRRFDSLKRWLRKSHPSNHTYRIVFTNKLKDNAAETVLFNDGHFIVYLRKSRGYNTLVDDLLHEMAHVFTFTANSIKEHTQEFWLVHGKLYNSFLKWTDSKNKK